MLGGVELKCFGQSEKCWFFFFFQAEDGIRDLTVTGVQTCALPICRLSPTVCSSGISARAAKSQLLTCRTARSAKSRFRSGRSSAPSVRLREGRRDRKSVV